MLKPFNIEAVRKGAKCVTRAGFPARLVSEKAYGNDDYPFMFLICENNLERARTISEEGKALKDLNSSDDLFLDVEPIYKPFTYETIPLGRVIIFSSPNGRMKASINWANNFGVSVMLGVDAKSITYDKLLSDYKFDNGEPCGILES